MKKVLLMVIDAGTPWVLERTMHDGKLPNLLALSQAGLFYPAGNTIFPSVTHAALASLVTGRYPVQHGILGSYWYNAAEADLAYYIGDLDVVLNEGIGYFYEDFLSKLNHQRLRAETIFQKVEQAGYLGASLNSLIFRGNTPHQVNVPPLLSLLPGIPSGTEVCGPTILHLGDFVSSGLDGVEGVRGVGGPLNWFGIKDGTTADLLLYLAEKRSFPDLTVAYFPDNDTISHRVGPEAAVTTLIHFDERLGQLFDAFGGVEALLEQVCIIVTADHSQVDIVGDATAAIELNNLLSDFKLAEAGLHWTSEDDLMVCPSMRAVQIYFQNLEIKTFHTVIANLLADERVDQVIWCAEITEPETYGYRIATHDRGALHFWQGESGPNTAVDEYGNVWSWAGDLHAVDGKTSTRQVQTRKILTFPEYPNAFERIAGILGSRNSGPLWATARPGYEFCIPRTSFHPGGGSHGSLHVSDSAIPLFVAGAPVDFYLPEHFRAVDVTSLCLQVLGLQHIRPIGTSALNPS